MADSEKTETENQTLQTGFFFGLKSHRHHYQIWSPSEPARAVLIVCHGLGEHLGRYQLTAEYLNAHGYVVAALDHIGHGQTEGKPGHVEAFSDYLDGVDLFTNEIRNQFPELPLYLVGHSMGGLISTAYLLTKQERFNGAILSAPAVEAVERPGPIQTLLLKFISMVAPQLGVLPLDASAISRDQAIVDAYLADSLVFNGKYSARLVNELGATMDLVEEKAGDIRLPLLIMHGTDDRLVPSSGSEKLASLVSSEDVTLKLYPDLYHEIFNEPEREAVLSDVCQWLQARLETAQEDV